jgi:hypothetical protein
MRAISICQQNCEVLAVWSGAAVQFARGRGSARRTGRADKPASYQWQGRQFLPGRLEDQLCFNLLLGSFRDVTRRRGSASREARPVAAATGEVCHATGPLHAVLCCAACRLSWPASRLTSPLSGTPAMTETPSHSLIEKRNVVLPPFQKEGGLGVRHRN